MTKPKATARIHLILARNAPIVAVFRRGPSKQVALLEWNLSTDTVRLGQWLKGRIYARRADLSPDGRHLIYFAASHLPDDAYGGSWTAVSRMPFLTALHIYGWGHCWNGGGLFVNDRDYWLNGGGSQGPDASVKCSLRRVMKAPRGMTEQMGEDPVTYFPQLLRDGWTAYGKRSEDGAQVFLFGKAANRDWFLEKAFHIGSYVGRWKESYCETHRLIGPDGAVIDMPDAESADIRDGEVISAEQGRLMRRCVHATGPGPARLVADLNDMTFSEAKSDYVGVEAATAPSVTQRPHPVTWGWR